MAPRKKLNPAEEAIAIFKKSQAARKGLDLDKLMKLKKSFKATVDKSKRDHQELREKVSIDMIKKSQTRSGKKRGVATRGPESSNGKWINKGMDDADETFDDEEQEYLRKAIKDFKSVSDLKFEHIKYLIGYVFLDDLRKIREGKLESAVHDRYKELGSECKSEMLTEIRTSLFTNDQRDYLYGLLQGIFKANTMDLKGDIPYSEIEYVEIVMVAESTSRIVKFIHNFDSFEETYAFMKKKSREAYGISDDEEGD